MKSLEAPIGECSYDIRGTKNFKTHKVEITKKSLLLTVVKLKLNSSTHQKTS